MSHFSSLLHSIWACISFIQCILPSRRELGSCFQISLAAQHSGRWPAPRLVLSHGSFAESNWLDMLRWPAAPTSLRSNDLAGL